MAKNARAFHLRVQAKRGKSKRVMRLLKSSSRIVFALVFTGCGASQETAAPLHEVGSSDRDAGNAKADADAPVTMPEPLPPEPRLSRIDAPASGECRLDGDGATFSLLTKKNDRPIVSRRHALVHARIDRDVVVVEAETNDVRVRGFGTVFVYPKKAFAFSPTTLVDGATELIQHDASGASLAVSFPDLIKMTTRTIACTDLALTPNHESTAKSLVSGLDHAKSMNVIATKEKPIAVAEDSTDAPTSKIVFATEVKVLEAARDKSHIAWEAQGALHVGWIQTRALTQKPLPPDPPGTIRIDEVMIDSVNFDEEEKPGPVTKAAKTPVICAHDVRLATVSYGDAYVIGLVKANTQLVLMDDKSNALPRLARMSLDLTVAADVDLAVPARDLVGCKNY